MKKSTILSLITTSLCYSEGSALVDIALPASLPAASSLIASQSHVFSPAATFAQSTIVSSSISIADTISLPQMAGEDALTDMAHFALDFSGLLNPSSKLMMRLSALGSSSLTIAESMPLTAATTASPLVEAEVLSDMAHVALDFSGLLSPSKSMMRLYSIFGRLFALSADYLPDHTIHPEELLIQFFLICVTMRELIQEKLVEAPQE
eukprot:CAMPEP_0113605854 /NCGR_PEP_ID=MMETSP0017_2-20120614/2551_1 /TAXON_ID=2856 /ORGANISM="Cylindrotheca closterium" /LENGTH=206 /DNA_ID=CAMNT_0000514375 /DNA_START=48 /DNA_END=668 /DNA_ORIENTATION=+ /assembly_acc=CAM_ASM_000147